MNIIMTICGVANMLCALFILATWADVATPLIAFAAWTALGLACFATTNRGN